MAICHEELRRCQRLSPRPNFVTLVGDRYGWRFAAGTGRLEWGEDAHGYVYVWDFKSQNPLHVLRAHSSEVLTLAACPSGRSIVSGSSDATVRVWDTDSGAERSVYGICAFACPACHSWHSRSTDVGCELRCPTCGQPLQFCPYVVDGNWHEIAAAWSNR
jgi:WD40 repeat protein